MLGNYQVAIQLAASRVMLSYTELVRSSDIPTCYGLISCGSIPGKAKFSLPFCTGFGPNARLRTLQKIGLEDKTPEVKAAGA
jgi:hypothetical protein